MKKWFASSSAKYPAIFWTAIAISLALGIWNFLSLRADRKEYEEKSIPVVETQLANSYLQEH